MRFVSWNVNGLRAAIRKGIDEYFQDLAADVVMLQETQRLRSNCPRIGAGPHRGRYRFIRLKRKDTAAWPRPRPYPTPSLPKERGRTRP